MRKTTPGHRQCLPDTVIKMPSRFKGNVEIFHRLKEIFGSNRVRNSSVETLLYAQDISPESLIARRAGRAASGADFIVRPVAVEEISRLMRVASRWKIPILPYGAGTSRRGSVAPLEGGIVCDMKRMNRILSIDDESLIVSAQAGILGEHLEHELNRKGFTLGHFPWNFRASTLGGWVATRSAGEALTKYGGIADMVVSMQAVLPDGSIVKTRTAPRSATGPDFNRLLTGSEGTLAIMTRVKLRIHVRSRSVAHLSFRFKKFSDGVLAARQMLHRGLRPSTIHLFDKSETAEFFADSKLRLSGNMLLITFEGHESRTEMESRIAEAICSDYGGDSRGEEPSQYRMEHRFSRAFRTSPAFSRKGVIIDTIEIGAPWSSIQNVYESLAKALSKRFEICAFLSRPTSQGAALTFTITAKATKESDIDLHKNLWDKAVKAVQSSGGAFIPTSGVGLRGAGLFAEQMGAAHNWLKEVKVEIDPNRILNPGKLGL